ncbi:hypothetical protein CEXT_245011 [Caerostris extrusa]|uniref:Uncharacterized protein n=1 Tax=Caerostris extrusa TaxID=172846 RepID=A0AAV4V3C1_CAEEX|nr:hypothetical protein CEXT_245011 [Caerostris extrusa]
MRKWNWKTIFPETMKKKVINPDLIAAIIHHRLSEDWDVGQLIDGMARKRLLADNARERKQMGEEIFFCEILD